MSAAKNVPLVTTIGFDVASEGGATSSANTANGHAASNSVLASQEGEVVAPVEEKAKTKTYITDYDITETLGEGSFGAVVYGVHKETKQACAIKILNKAHIVKEKKDKYVKMERDVFAMCNHRNVVKLYKTFSSPENLYYVLEVCPNGELLSHIKKHGSFDVASATYYTADICGGLEHLHQLGIVHRDLKPENILMSADMRCKLTDFGTSKILDDDIKNDWNARLRTQSFVGTPEYIAPELLDARDTCRATDLFALGSIVFQMITGRPPFKAKTEYLTIEKVKALDYQFPEGFPDVPAAFCKALLVRDPAQRLGAGPDGYAKLRAHELFAGFDWDGMAADAPPPPISSSGLKERIDARERLAGEAAQSDGGGAASSNGGGGGGGAASSSSGLQYLSDEEHDKWRSFLLADEKIIKSGFVYKYKGLSVKKRQLLLTNKPRLIYVSLAKQVVKGEIPWSHDILAVAKNPTSFWIQTPDRKYILQDKDQKDAEGWAKAIEGLKSHLKQQASKKS